MRVAAGLAFGVVATTLVAFAAPADEKPKTPTSVYRELFPRPTGKNGYEELILAGETVRASRLYLRAEGAGQREMDAKSLAFKRRVLADPPVAKALTLIRQGLSKSIVPLRRGEEQDTGNQQSRLLRTVMRLMSLQQYVLLADGRVAEAIATARQGLRIGQVLYTEPQISGLLGLSFANGSLQSLARHLDQLSARDCELLYLACSQWLELPDPQASEIAESRHQVPTQIAEIRAKIASGGIAALKDLQVYEEEVSETVQDALAGSPQQLDGLFRQATHCLDQVYAHDLAQLRKPPWERRWDLPNPEANAGSQLIALVHPPYDEISDAYTRGTASLQLFACHCALRRYRWEYDRLPETLAELRLGDIGIDPFSGKPFSYERTGSRYRLSSAGPTADDEDPTAVNGRIPLSITPDDR